jgi:hypothetical protein
MASDPTRRSKKNGKANGDGREAPPAPAHDVHGARELPNVLVEGYSLQLRDEGGFLGDQASQTAFRELL